MMNPGSLTKVFSVIEQSFKASTKKHAKPRNIYFFVPLFCRTLYEFPENVPLGPLWFSDIAKVKDFPVKRHTALQNITLQTWLFIKYCGKPLNDYLRGRLSYWSPHWASPKGNNPDNLIQEFPRSLQSVKEGLPMYLSCLLSPPQPPVPG